MKHAMEVESEEQERWKAESDLRTLLEAAKIKADKSRSAAAMRMATEQQKELSKIKGKGNG